MHLQAGQCGNQIGAKVSTFFLFLLGDVANLRFSTVQTVFFSVFLNAL